jgi:hypothetical protein
MLTSPGCCADCEPVTMDAYLAINRQALAGYRASLGCDAVGCGACLEPVPGTATGQNFGATCEMGRCVAFDVRQFGRCAVDSDCTLRMGVECCEGCGVGQPVSVPYLGSFLEYVCGAEPQACDACLPTYPAGMTAVCVDATCAIGAPCGLDGATDACGMALRGPCCAEFDACAVGVCSGEWTCSLECFASVLEVTGTVGEADVVSCVTGCAADGTTPTGELLRLVECVASDPAAQAMCMGTGQG